MGAHLPAHLPRGSSEASSRVRGRSISEIRLVTVSVSTQPWTLAKHLADHLPSFLHLGFESGTTSGPPSAQFPTSTIRTRRPVSRDGCDETQIRRATLRCNTVGHLHWRAHERRVVPDVLKLCSRAQVTLLRELGMAISARCAVNLFRWFRLCRWSCHTPSLAHP